jgi:hypothetical protein
MAATMSEQYTPLTFSQAMELVGPEVSASASEIILLMYAEILNLHKPSVNKLVSQEMHTDAFRQRHAALVSLLEEVLPEVWNHKKATEWHAEFRANRNEPPFEEWLN